MVVVLMKMMTPTLAVDVYNVLLVVVAVVEILEIVFYVCVRYYYL